MKNSRILNIKYSVDGLHFDAAVDVNRAMHYYDIIFGMSEKEMVEGNVVPIEIYCLDNNDWGIWVTFQNTYNNEDGMFAHTEVDFEQIVKETKCFIQESKK